MGIPENENLPIFVCHIILAVVSTGIWILCAALIEEKFPTHLHAWIIFELSLAVAQTLYGIWASIIDSRDSTFYERKSETFFFTDMLLLVMNVATAVTGAVYWRNGDSEKHLIFDTAVVLTWITLVTLTVVLFQDRAKMSSS